jgi:hypothetical protein
LQLVEGFFGVDEALTDYRRGARAWAATLIVTGADVAEARARGDEAVKELARCERLTHAPEADSLASTEAMRS